MLSENGKIPGSRPITARTAKNGVSEVTGHAQAVSITPPIRADFIKGGLRMAFFNSEAVKRSLVKYHEAAFLSEIAGKSRNLSEITGMGFPIELT